MYRCLCDCGSIRVVHGRVLRSGDSSSCGCLHDELFKAVTQACNDAKIIPAGTRFARLVVEAALDRRDNWGSRYYRCICDCGNQAEVIAKNLTLEKTRSCGCLASETARATAYRVGLGVTPRHVTHGLTKHPAYRAWYRVRDRCLNPNARSYRYYGARGIKLARAWQTVEPFVEWSLAHGWAPGYHIHRIDSDGPYSPSNCEWLSPAEHHLRHGRKVG